MRVNSFDVVVVGGGAAGLSGALTLARARRSVLVLDSGEPRNAAAEGVRGFLSRDGMTPADLIAAGAAEVIRYGGQVRAACAVSARREGNGFVVGTADEQTVTASRLLVATGLVDELPDIPGLRERWGHDVLGCPYCHGWEVRDRPIGVLNTGRLAVHQALLFRQWSPDTTLFLHTGPQPSDDEWEQLAACGIAVVDGEVTALEVAADRLAGIRLASGHVIARQALAVMPRFSARAEFLTELGLPTVAHPTGLGTYLESDATGLTAIPGVWAAGNVTDPTAQVVVAAAAGVTAAAAINADLIAADTHRAVEYRRDPFSGPSEALVSERVLGDRRHGLETPTATATSDHRTRR
ncbi:NAD(P)/FAD-dependent oxidoreductase [uncultured Mycobacterium sp.]|uniref:NAD(P)/FAD-dependent oxidoreductase n=1 Tax=uncultured Mycobacterium sp. TaxID=171292 RepID=UPI0035CA43A2